MSKPMGDDVYAERDEWRPSPERFLRYLAREAELAERNRKVVEPFIRWNEDTSMCGLLWLLREFTLHSRETLVRVYDAEWGSS